MVAGAALARLGTKAHGTWSEPSLPKTRRPLSWLRLTPVASCARMPPGNCAEATAKRRCRSRACSSAKPVTLRGIGEGLALRRAGDEARDRRGVAADVEDAAAAELVFEEAAFGMEPAVKTERRLDDADLADGAAADQLDELRGLRMAAVHERFHEEDAVLARGLGHDGIASAWFRVSGFSQRMCFFARAALMHHSACSGCGVLM